MGLGSTSDGHISRIEGVQIRFALDVLCNEALRAYVCTCVRVYVSVCVCARVRVCVCASACVRCVALRVNLRGFRLCAC